MFPNKLGFDIFPVSNISDYSKQNVAENNSYCTDNRNGYHCIEIIVHIAARPDERAPDISILNEFCPERFFEKLLCVNMDKKTNNSITHRIHFPVELFGTPAPLQCITKLS